MENNFTDTPSEYFEFLKNEIKDIRTPNYLTSSNNTFYYNNVKEIIDYLAELLKALNVKFSNLIDLCKILYERAYILPKDLILFLKNEKGIELNYFDKHLNREQYRLNFKEWISSKKELSKEEAICIALNLNSIYAKQIFEIDKKTEKTPYSKWKVNEELFFYKSYQRFLKEERYYCNGYDMICRFNNIDKEFDFDGNIFTFLNDLHNAGWVLHEELIDYLESIKKAPKYNMDSPILGIYKNV